MDGVTESWVSYVGVLDRILDTVLSTPGIRWLMGYEHVDRFDSAEEERFQTRLADEQLLGCRMTSLTIAAQCLLATARSTRLSGGVCAT